MLKIRGLALSQLFIVAVAGVIGFYFHQLAHRPSHRLPKLNAETQLVQVGELLPRPASTRGQIDGRDFIYKTLVQGLPLAYQGRAELIAYTLISESNKHSLDPLFVLAVIQTESRFNPGARGKHGELGLMQILPESSSWIARRIKMKGKV